MTFTLDPDWSEDSRWVRTKERLPPLHVPVLAYAVSGTYSALHMSVLCRDEQSIWTDGRTGFCADRDISHWQPLPGAP